ncbi:MAG: transporter permease [Chloroflexi bacterium]|nr:transporter permease [Chloroflexota bacterium]
MILRNLLRRKTRTLLTMFGIGIGVAAIIVLGVMVDGLQAGYGSMLAGSKADLVLSQPDSFDISYSSVDETIGKELAVMPEVSAISGMLQGWTQTESEPFFFVFGYPTDSFALDHFQMLAGQRIDSREARGGTGKPVMLGSAAAEVLKKSVGDSLRLTGSLFRVVGIYETGDAFEDSAAVANLADAQELVGRPRTVSLFYIQLKDPGLRERFVTRIERKYPDLRLSGIQEYTEEQGMQDILGAFVWVLGGLAILIGGVGMMNSQLMSVFERTREIGVLRSLGWSSRRVLWMILGETLLVCLGGGILGIALGWLALVWLSNRTVFMGLVSTNISSGLILQAGVVVLTLGLLGGLYPAWRAARLQPVEALRYEGGTTGGKVRRLPLGGMAIQSLWQRSLRTFLTLAMIGISVGAIISLEAFVGGMQTSMGDMFSGVEVMVRQANISDTELSVFDERIGDKIEARPEVKSVSGVIFSAVMLPDAGSFFIVFGMEPNEYAIRRYKIVEGEPLSGNRQIIIGKSMAEILKTSIGDTIELSGLRYHIVGFYESQVGWEELGGVLPLRDAQILTGRPHKVSMLAIKMAEPDQASNLASWINNQYPEVSAAMSSDFIEQMPDFQTTGSMISGISLFAILIGGIGVMNTMLMAVYERTREIGVLRSLGWRRGAILGMILKEAFWLGLLGGVAGVLVAFGIIYLIALIPTVGPMVQPTWSWEVFVRALVVALILGLLGGLYPAYRATRLQPVEALRYE